MSQVTPADSVPTLANRATPLGPGRPPGLRRGNPHTTTPKPSYVCTVCTLSFVWYHKVLPGAAAIAAAATAATAATWSRSGPDGSWGWVLTGLLSIRPLSLGVRPVPVWSFSATLPPSAGLPSSLFSPASARPRCDSTGLGCSTVAPW